MHDEEEKILDIGDVVIDRRNGVTHYSDVNSLQKQVTKGMEVFTLFPVLHAKCRDEFYILENFNVIKKYSVCN